MIAGGETAGVPFAAALAEAMSKPMAYVRSAERNHGTASLVEGSVVPGGEALLVEDLVTDGASKLGFIAGLRDAGMRVTSCFVVLDRESGGADALRSAEVDLLALVTAMEVLEAGRELGDIDDESYSQAASYLRRERVKHP